MIRLTRNGLDKVVRISPVGWGWLRWKQPRRAEGREDEEGLTARLAVAYAESCGPNRLAGIKQFGGSFGPAALPTGYRQGGKTRVPGSYHTG
jgi:hypothetical protein